MNKYLQMIEKKLRFPLMGAKNVSKNKFNISLKRKFSSFKFFVLKFRLFFFYFLFILPFWKSVHPLGKTPPLPAPWWRPPRLPPGYAPAKEWGANRWISSRTKIYIKGIWHGHPYQVGKEVSIYLYLTFISLSILLL